MGDIKELDAQDIQIPQSPESKEFSNYVVDMEKLKAKVTLCHVPGLRHLPRPK